MKICCNVKENDARYCGACLEKAKKSSEAIGYFKGVSSDASLAILTTAMNEMDKQTQERLGRINTAEQVLKSQAKQFRDFLINSTNATEEQIALFEAEFLQGGTQ